jgi:hypothetical protein
LDVATQPSTTAATSAATTVAAVQVFTCLFGLDIILNMFTGFFGDGGAIVETQPLILSAYCQGWFWIDLAASFP